MTSTQDPAATATDPARFSGWWQKRSASPRIDRHIVKAAASAALITSSSGMLALTGKGASMRKQHLDSTPRPPERDAADLARRLRERRGA